MEDTLRAYKDVATFYRDVVLILVLMEDTLRVKLSDKAKTMLEKVLILVLMEDTLRVYNSSRSNASTTVLILVLMEDTLRVREQLRGFRGKSLNPCFNGRYSQSWKNIHSLL